MKAFKGLGGKGVLRINLDRSLVFIISATFLNNYLLTYATFLQKIVIFRIVFTMIEF